MNFPRLENVLSQKARLHCEMEMKNAEVKRRENRDAFMAFYQYMLAIIQQHKDAGAAHCVIPLTGINFLPKDTQDMMHLAVGQISETLNGHAVVEVDSIGTTRFPHDGVIDDPSPVTMEVMRVKIAFINSQ